MAEFVKFLKISILEKLNNTTLFVLLSRWVTSDSATSGTAGSFTMSQSLLKFMSTELAMLSYRLILWHALLLPSVFPSIRVFSSESAAHTQ